ncbi:protein EVI2B [Hippopotamus amphibius kiboko]|uniref:protein EVI2B n=1 Tax=Hippopotamus amphibius kiboko TaxID=575201 RepID=UPI002597E191|nr:protein EVI2B [Hippopotamus amphibius kiboko]XP_057570083.1 protein EVI2B [Hippopotamus amphibius kiboko]
MDPKYFILILFCGHLNDAFCSVTEATTTEKQPQSTLFRSSMPYVSANSQSTTENPLGQPTEFNNLSSGQPITTAKVATGQPTAAAYASSGKPVAHTPAGQPLAYNVTRKPIPMANTSSQGTALPAFTSAGQLSPSAHSTRQAPPSVYTPTQQPSSIHTSSRKLISPTVHNLSIEPTPTVKSSPRATPGFILEPISENSPQATNANSIAATLIGVILTSMLVIIFLIVLWKCLRKPVLNDQNWAGRSPFADGETPDVCLDNIRENEVFTKRTSIISIMAWKPSKSTLLADDLEVKLFESNENIEESNNPKTEKIKDQANGTSEDSADGSTVGTAVSSSDDADLPPPPPPLLDLEGKESNQSDNPPVTTVSPPPNDSTNLPSSLDCLNQVCEDHNSELKQSFPPPPDSLNLTLPPEDLMKNQEDANNEIQCQESPVPPDSDQDLNESLPPPPAELAL